MEQYPHAFEKLDAPPDHPGTRLEIIVSTFNLLMSAWIVFGHIYKHHVRWPPSPLHLTLAITMFVLAFAAIAWRLSRPNRAAAQMALSAISTAGWIFLLMTS